MPARFGIPESAIEAALENHRGIHRAGCYVPTEEEVATAPAPHLIPILTDWFWESPSEVIPSIDAIAQVLAILERRPDADQFQTFIAQERRDFELNGDEL